MSSYQSCTTFQFFSFPCPASKCQAYTSLDPSAVCRNGLSNHSARSLVPYTMKLSFQSLEPSYHPFTCLWICSQSRCGGLWTALVRITWSDSLSFAPSSDWSAYCREPRSMPDAPSAHCRTSFGIVLRRARYWSAAQTRLSFGLAWAHNPCSPWFDARARNEGSRSLSSCSGTCCSRWWTFSCRYRVRVKPFQVPHALHQTCYVLLQAHSKGALWAWDRPGPFQAWQIALFCSHLSSLSKLLAGQCHQSYLLACGHICVWDLSCGLCRTWEAQSASQPRLRAQA